MAGPEGLSCPSLAKTSWQPTNPALDSGERSAIAAALQMPGCLLIIDDRAGRAEAKSHRLSVIGTAAVVGLAKLQGLIPTARPVLERLQPASRSGTCRVARAGRRRLSFVLIDLSQDPDPVSASSCLS